MTIARRLVGGALTLLAAGLLAGCAAPADPGDAPGSGQRATPALDSSEAALAPRPAPSIHDLGRLTQRVIYADDGLVLNPPGSAAPRLSWTAAWSQCVRSRECTQISGSRTVVLALLTTPGGGRIKQIGAIPPTTKEVLSYVFTWTGVGCVPVGGPGTPAQSAPPPHKDTCTIWDPVDAGTGHIVGGEVMQGGPASGAAAPAPAPSTGMIKRPIPS